MRRLTWVGTWLKTKSKKTQSSWSPWQWMKLKLSRKNPKKWQRLKIKKSASRWQKTMNSLMNKEIWLLKSLRDVKLTSKLWLIRNKRDQFKTIPWRKKYSRLISKRQLILSLPKSRIRKRSLLPVTVRLYSTRKKAKSLSSTSTLSLIPRATSSWERLMINKIRFLLLY